jgi:hypothetical protein
MRIGRGRAQVVHAQVEKALFARLRDQAVREEAFDKRREDREDLDPHVRSAFTRTGRWADRRRPGRPRRTPRTSQGSAHRDRSRGGRSDRDKRRGGRRVAGTSNTNDPTSSCALASGSSMAQRRGRRR